MNLTRDKVYWPTDSRHVAVVRIGTNKPHIDLSLVRTLAVFGIVFYHTLDLLSVSRDLKAIIHLLFGVPSLTMLLLFSGMTMGVMQMPANLRGYLKYLRVYALGHLRVYTVFFIVQTAIAIMYYYHVDAGESGMGHGPFNPVKIAIAYIFASGYGSLGIWYMHMLALAVAIWPLTGLVRRVPVWIVFGGLLVISYYTGYLAPAGLSYFMSRCCYCVATIYLGQRAGWLRNGNHWRQGWIFGSLYIITNILFLILLFNKTFPSYRAFPVYVDTSETFRVMSYAIATASRFWGALFFISGVGMIGAKLSRLRAYFAKGAYSSYYIYLMHRVVHYACPSVVLNHIRSAMLSWMALPQITVALLGALLLMIIGYYVWVFARHRPCLNYLVFGKGQKPHSGWSIRQRTKNANVSGNI